MQTAPAARATVPVTDNTRGFPIGETRNGVRPVTAGQFVAALDARCAAAEATIRRYLG